jgi:hypothetical protein
MRGNGDKCIKELFKNEENIQLGIPKYKWKDNVL